jgi:hypothetical protein
MGSPTSFTSTPAPATPCKASRTSSIFTPGKMRQFTLAEADCGSAFSACPPLSMVATQVVHNFPACVGLRAITSTADPSRGLAENRRIASPSSPGVVAPASLNAASVVSFHITGKRWARSFSSAAPRS